MSASTIRTRAIQRTGVTLLFVMSMIVLFLLMGTAFLVISNDFYKSANSRSKRFIHSNTYDGTELVERAFYDLLRGPSLGNTSSPLRGHSLLGDMYGYGFVVSAESASLHQSEHFIQIQLRDDAVKMIDGESYTPRPVPGLMGGLVLTVASGASTGLTTRVIDHQVIGDETNGYTHWLLVAPTAKDIRFDVDRANSIHGQRLVVNGRAFAGTGAGNYTPGAQGVAALDEAEPNQFGTSLDDLIGKNGGPGYFTRLLGSDYYPNSAAPNESYDAFDRQNAFLAGVDADGNLTSASFYGNKDDKWTDFLAFQEEADDEADSDLDDDDFIQVDNNNDGKEDGIWLDIGLPIQCRKDGSCVKPLVSYLVLDLDSRLNVNAHGSLFRDVDSTATTVPLLDRPTSLVRGQGYGPPEIDLSAVMNGAESSVIRARYGEDGRPGEADVRDDWSSYKLFGYPEASFDDFIPGTVQNHFSTLMDLHGRFSVGYPGIFDIDDNTFPIGMPVANIGVSILTNEVVDSPYEMSFVDTHAFGPNNQRLDSPFRADEFETVLRPSDPDTRFLPKRLVNLAPAVFRGKGRHLLTTHSFEVPTVYANLPSRLFRILDTNNSGSGYVGLPNNETDRELKIRNLVRTMLPPEVFRGLPMNVNRPFGDGQDNNNNGIVDEIGELDIIDHPTGGKVLFDHDNDANVGSDGDEYLARSNFARNLYVMTLLTTERVDRNGDGIVTVDDWYDFNEDGFVNQADLIEYRKVIAQWTVNVVDFRDPDSIMTPFEADLNPWNGWDVDGDLGSAENIPDAADRQMRKVFWGAERPELLLTETFATHDRRTQDLENEAVPDGEIPALHNGGQGDEGEFDADLDSHLVPKVSAFFELYNPWVINDANQLRPAELYDRFLDGVDLQKTSADGSPVWRLVVTDFGQQDLDPDDPDKNNHGEVANEVRRIYFRKPASNVDSGPEVYFPEDDIQVNPVEPGRYAVVGTAGVRINDRFDTFFGRRNSADALTSPVLHQQTRRLSLDPVNQTLEILWYDETAAENEALKVESRPVVNIPIGMTDTGYERELGISDPVQGYWELTGLGGIQVETSRIEDGWKFVEDETLGVAQDYIFDEPVDRQLDRQNYDDFLKDDGLKPGYRTVHLQRLANPLIAFHETRNPYITIDSSSIDLFVFNGVMKAEVNGTTTDANNIPGVMRFGSYERRCDLEGPNSQVEGGVRLLFRNDRAGFLLRAEDDTNPAIGRDDSHFFSLNLFDNLENNFESLGKLNDAYKNAEADDPKPFAWLTWNNRPYVSQLELANVPYTSSYWMTRLFNTAETGRDPFVVLDATNPETGTPGFAGPFPHLLNFYADETETGTPALGLSQLFDFTEVPSRFNGTETFVNPKTFGNDRQGVSFGLAAPFDRISNYRYPGKVNINTINDVRVWKAMMGEHADTVSYADWVTARDASPYRPAYAHSLVSAAPNNPADTGLFRKDTTSGEPLFDGASDQRHNDASRSAYFRNEIRQRMPNLVTGRSSVFAVWVTVGFFKVKDGDGGDRTYELLTRPDDKKTGLELGEEDDVPTRYRGFFIVDRSIPVGFEPGKNLNADRTVLVKTIIE